MFEEELGAKNSFQFALEYSSNQFLFIPSNLAMGDIVLFDMKEIALSTFATPKLIALQNLGGNASDGDQTVLDVFKPAQFDQKKCPYIFLRLADSIRYFNVDLASNGEYRLTTLLMADLQPLPFKYPAGSIMRTIGQEVVARASDLKLFTLETVNGNQAAEASGVMARDSNS